MCGCRQTVIGSQEEKRLLLVMMEGEGKDRKHVVMRGSFQSLLLSRVLSLETPVVAAPAIYESWRAFFVALGASGDESDCLTCEYSSSSRCSSGCWGTWTATIGP